MKSRITFNFHQNVFWVGILTGLNQDNIGISYITPDIPNVQLWKYFYLCAYSNDQYSDLWAVETLPGILGIFAACRFCILSTAERVELDKERANSAMTYWGAIVSKLTGCDDVRWIGFGLNAGVGTTVLGNSGRSDIPTT